MGAYRVSSHSSASDLSRATLGRPPGRGARGRGRGRGSLCPGRFWSGPGWPARCPTRGTKSGVKRTRAGERTQNRSLNPVGTSLSPPGVDVARVHSLTEHVRDTDGGGGASSRALGDSRVPGMGPPPAVPEGAGLQGTKRQLRPLSTPPADI